MTPSRGPSEDDHRAALEAELAAAFGSVDAQPAAHGGEGDGDAHGGRAPQTVLERMADAAIARCERLPMLDVIMDRVVRQFTERLMQLMSSDVDANVSSIRTGRFEDVFNEIELPCLIAVIEVAEWGGECMLAIDQRLVFTIVEIMLGGDADVSRGDGVGGDALREPTPIERRISRRIFDVFCEMLTVGFSQLRPAQFKVLRVETHPKFAQVARPAAASVRARIQVSVDNCGGDFSLIVPYTTLEPVRAQLGQMFMGERLGRDASWDQRLSGGVGGAPVRLSATVAGEPVMLSDVIRWKPGDVLPLREAGAQAHAVLACKSIKIGEGPVGSQNGKLAVKLDTVFAAATDDGAGPPQALSSQATPMAAVPGGAEGGAGAVGGAAVGGAAGGDGVVDPAALMAAVQAVAGGAAPVAGREDGVIAAGAPASGAV